MMHINGIASRHNLLGHSGVHKEAWVWDVEHFGSTIGNYFIWTMYLLPQKAYLETRRMSLETSVRILSAARRPHETR